jgi:methionine-rich copper-binding protein CopC
MSTLRTLTASAALAALVTLSAVPAFAHAGLASSIPAASATVAPTAKLELHFTEALEAKFSGAEVSATSMMMGGKMVDQVMKIDGIVAALDPADHKALILTLKTPLAAGTYKVAWHAVAADTHRSQGAYTFTVK